MVGGKVDQIPELVMLKVKCGKGQMAVPAAGGDVLPRGIGQQGFVLIAEAVVMVVRPAVEQFRPLAPALHHGADCQHQGGRDTAIPKAQHQPAANGSQQHTCHPRQTRAGGEHRPEVHQELRDGHGEQRFSVHRDGVSARGNQIQHQHHSAGNEPVAVGGKEFFRLAGVADYAEHRQHHGQRCSDACIDILLPALCQPWHKQAEVIRPAEVAVGVARKVDSERPQQHQLRQRRSAERCYRCQHSRRAAFLQGAAHRVSHKHKTDHRQVVQMDARTEQPHARPDKAGAAGRGHKLVTAQPEVEGQQHKPVGGECRVGKHAHCHRREQHK